MKIKQGVLSTHDEIMALAQHTKWEMIYNGQAYIYTKRDVYLENDGFLNKKIFLVLGLDPVETCSQIYGYHPYNGDWPEWHHNDDAALPKVFEFLITKGVIIVPIK